MAVGGWKKSGLGVENGRRGIEAWLQNKSLQPSLNTATTILHAQTALLPATDSHLSRALAPRAVVSVFAKL
jgi:hypothetical protein